MGILDGFLNPNKNTNAKYKKAKQGWRGMMRETNPFYREVLGSGRNANSRLADFLGLNGADTQRLAMESYVTSPEFDFQLDRGVGAIDQSAFSRGGLQSGKTLMDQQRFGQGLFAQDFGNHLSRLAGVTGQGFMGAQGLADNERYLGQLKIGQGQAADAGNAAAFGNMVGLGSTIISAGMGMPPMGQGGQLSQLFGRQEQAPVMPTYSNGRVNPYATY